MLSNLREEVKAAAQESKIIAGFNIFGAEDAIGVIRAAVKRNAPVFLMINKDALKLMPMKSWIDMLKPMIESLPVSIGVHLDHCSCPDTVIEGIKSGFSSVMYDGSQLPIEENIYNIRRVIEEASRYDVAVEGEIGSVPYEDIPGRAKDICTEPMELERFSDEGQMDWIAVAIGQVHRMQTRDSKISFTSLRELERHTEKPLVIHGGSGISEEDLFRLKNTGVGKINVGTALRIPFFKTLQREIKENPFVYDRDVLFEKPTLAVEIAADKILSILGFE
ncbi:MAG: fructose-bisphosphate aldolase [Firmicutes bacterium]|nr:fructose-bisphosphate aldolase [Bacillota bacterium]